jgi:cobalt/nickel transport system permease protein
LFWAFPLATGHLLPTGVACKGSFVARLDPRWKLVAIAVAMIAVCVVRGLPSLLAAFAGTILLLLLARVPIRWMLQRLAAIAPFLIVIVVLLPFLFRDEAPVVRIGGMPISQRGIEAAAAIALKMLTLLGLASVILATTPFHVLLQGARRLGLPGLIAHLGLLTHRYLFLLGNELRRLRTTLQVRGFRSRATIGSYRVIGRLAGTLLVRSSERAERVGQAMRCRGFDRTFRSLELFRTTWADVCVCVLVVVFAASLVALDRVGH